MSAQIRPARWRCRPAPAWRAEMPDPCLILLVGAAGSGKSTLARQLAEGDDQILSLDGLREAVSGDQADQAATSDAVAVLHLLAEARARRRLTTVIDATNLQAAARAPLLAIARRHDVSAVAIVMTTPLEICLARNAARPGPAPGARWGRRVPEHVVRAQHVQMRRELPVLATEGFTRILTCRWPASG